MSKSENEKWIATIPTQSSANSGNQLVLRKRVTIKRLEFTRRG